MSTLLQTSDDDAPPGSPSWRSPASLPSPTTPHADIGVDRFVLFPARAFLAFGWIRAGVEKAIDPEWWTGAKVADFLDAQSDSMLPFMAPLTEALVTPALWLTAWIVVAAEFVLGALLLTGRRLAPTLLAASALNVIFVLMGVVTPSAFYLVLQLTLLLAVATRAGWFTSTRRMAVIGASAVAAVALTPFIATLHPAEVIHDPAIMLATVAALLGATQLFSLVEARLARAGKASPLSSLA